MAAERIKATSQEFQDFVNLPEHDGMLFERINGEIVEVSPSFGYSSGVAFRIAVEVGIYLKTNDIASATGEGGGYDIDDEHTFAPDVAVILKSRLAVLPNDKFIPMPPDFADSNSSRC